MSQLTQFEALQLAAQLIEPTDTPNVQKLFEVAEAILAEDKKRNPPKKATVQPFNL